MRVAHAEAGLALKYSDGRRRLRRPSGGAFQECTRQRQESKKVAAVSCWSTAYLSVWSGVIVFAVTSDVLGFLVAKRYL
jgi:hypothetical protein